MKKDSIDLRSVFCDQKKLDFIFLINAKKIIFSEKIQSEKKFVGKIDSSNG